MATFNLEKLAAGGLIGLHFTPEELFIGHGVKRGRNFSVGSLDYIDIRAHTLEGGDFNVLTLVPILQQTLKQHRIKSRKTIITFPAKFPWIRVLDVPVVPEREMARIVRLEVERLYLDSSVEKLIDYYPLEPPRSRPPGGTTPVLSVAIPRNSIVPYVDLLGAAKLELVGIDLTEVNVLRLAAMQGVNFDDGITLILNFNMQSTDLMLMENNMLQLVRKVGQGKQQLRELLQRNLPTDSPLRRDLYSVDFQLPTEDLRLAGEHVSSLLGEIRRSIEFYLNDIKRAEGNVTKVVLAGSGYWPINLPAILGMQLHLPLIDLRFEHLPHVECLTSFGKDFPACGIFAPVIGSVLRGVA